MLNFTHWLEAEDYANRAGEPFWGNYGAGILPIARSTGRILVELRSPNVNEPNTWGVWGGRVDPEEEDNFDFGEIAKLEFAEETGYTGPIQLIPAYVFRTSGFEYHNFLGIIPNEFTPRMSWETSGYDWVTLDELFSLENKHPGLSKLLNDKPSQQRLISLVKHGNSSP